MRAAFALMGEQPPGLRLSCRNVIPHARGLGSSSAAIVAGVVLARALVAGGQLLRPTRRSSTSPPTSRATPTTSHPPSYGGFVISGREDDRWYAVRAGVDPRITAVVFVPPTGVETKVARGLLPETVAARRRRGQLRARRPARRRPGRPAGAPARRHARLAAPGAARARDARDARARPPPARGRRTGRGVGCRPDGAGVRGRPAPTWLTRVSATAGRATTWPIESDGAVLLA